MPEIDLRLCTQYTGLQVQVFRARGLTRVHYNQWLSVRTFKFQWLIFSSILSDSTDLSTCPQVKEVHSAFSTVGFVFLKNHGVERKLVGHIL